MSDDNKEFEDEIGRLRKQYRAVEAPSYLRTRISAHARAGQAVQRHWRPAFVAIPVAIAIFGILPFIVKQETESIVSPKLPSLTALSRLKPDKPTSVSPGLSRVRTVSAPPMPKKPKSDAAGDPQTNIETNQFPELKEHNYEYV